MLAGDEIASVVADIGSHTSKFGHAGIGSPTAVISSMVGSMESDKGAAMEDVEPDSTANKASKEYFVGDSALNIPRDGMEVESILKDGKVTDWKALENLWANAWENYLFVPSTERPMMVTDIHPEDHAQALELVFELFGCPATYFARSATLSTFCTGRRTALVVEVGASSARVSPVVDGYVLNKGVQRSFKAGDWLDQQALSLLEKQNIEVHPRFCVGKRHINEDGTPVKAPIIGPGGAHETYATLKKMDVIKDIKHSVCAVPEEPIEEEELLAEMPEQQYELPDGTVIKVEMELFLLPELLVKQNAAEIEAAFKEPKTLSSRQQEQKQAILPVLVRRALAECDADARKEMANNIVFCGGSSLFDGLAERLNYEITQILPSVFRVRVVNPTPLEKKFSTWIGGSILCSLGSFQQMWVSKREYQEEGARIAEDRFEY